MGDKLVKTGIAGLDAMLYGGIPEGNQIIISGGPGAGKTLLAFEFLYRNAKAGESGLFITLEEGAERVIANAKKAFNDIANDIDDVLKGGKLHIMDIDPTEETYGMQDDKEYAFGKLVADIEKHIEETNATRVVIDSATVLEILIKDTVLYRKSMLSLVNNFRRLGVTSVLSSEMTIPERDRMQFQPEHFIYDGIITMYQTEKELRRMLTIEVVKMRGSKHSFVTTPYDITPDGVKVFSAEEALS